MYIVCNVVKDRPCSDLKYCECDVRYWCNQQYMCHLFNQWIEVQHSTAMKGIKSTCISLIIKVSQHSTAMKGKRGEGVRKLACLIVYPQSSAPVQVAAYMDGILRLQRVQSHLEACMGTTVALLHLPQWLHGRALPSNSRCK